MKILIVGLGLIGGSICKTLKKNSSHTVIGTDINKDIETTAISDKSIDTAFSGDFSGIDIIISCLYPEATEEYFEVNASKLQKGTLITDVCGVKGEFSNRINNIAKMHELEYIGLHPMAGKEFGGYDNSTSELFVNANFIIVPFEDSNNEKVEILKQLADLMGAGKVIITHPENHDKMIAYTSQLAHIVSSAYVKSPELALECGFSGGSFQDMTRIATMNEKMWTDLFMQNKDNLIQELDTLIMNLNKYNEALKTSNVKEMQELIKEGRILKEENLKRRIGQPN